MKSVTNLLDEYTDLQIRGGSRKLSGQSQQVAFPLSRFAEDGAFSTIGTRG